MLMSSGVTRPGAKAGPRVGEGRRGASAGWRGRLQLRSDALPSSPCLQPLCPLDLQHSLQSGRHDSGSQQVLWTSPRVLPCPATHSGLSPVVRNQSPWGAILGAPPRRLMAPSHPRRTRVPLGPALAGLAAPRLPWLGMSLFPFLSGSLHGLSAGGLVPSKDWYQPAATAPAGCHRPGGVNADTHCPQCGGWKSKVKEPVVVVC